MLGKDLWWKRAPFIRLLLALCGGMLIYWYLKPPHYLLAIFFVTALFFCFTYLLGSPVMKFRLSKVIGLSIFILVMVLGTFRIKVLDPRNTMLSYLSKRKEHPILIARLIEDPIKRKNTFRVTAMAEYYIDNTIAKPVQGKLLLYFSSQKFLALPRYGDHILFSKPIEEIADNSNPGTFNYKRYCLYHGITGQVFLNTNNFSLLPSKTGVSFLNKTLNSTATRILNILRKYVAGDQEKGLAEALLIGYRNDLDPSLVRSYSNTGVVHIIAISGLHLGLIYWLLTGLFKGFRKYKVGGIMESLLVLVIIWLFSLLVGAQPSVLRAALMFSFILLGKIIQRNVSIYNSLAASAFFLLWMDPFSLWDIGFQLSYAAVISIIIFSKPLYHLFQSSNKLIDGLWKLLSVTIAAQILTTPLILYHFHQFPLLFLVSNVIAIPLSSIVLVLEIFLCAISSFSSIAVISGKLVTMLSRWMTDFIFFIERIPNSRIDGIQITVLQVLLIYIVVFSIANWLKNRSSFFLKAGILFSILFLAIRCQSFIKHENQNLIIVYNVPQSTVLEFIKGRTSLRVTDSSNTVGLKSFLLPSQTLFRIHIYRWITLKNEGVFQLDFCEKQILVINKGSCMIPPDKRIDLLVLCSKATPTLPKGGTNKNILQVVTDNSFPNGKANMLRHYCDSLGILFHNCKQQGAFVMNLR